MPRLAPYIDQLSEVFSGDVPLPGVPMRSTTTERMLRITLPRAAAAAGMTLLSSLEIGDNAEHDCCCNNVHEVQEPVAPGGLAQLLFLVVPHEQ